MEILIMINYDCISLLEKMLDVLTLKVKNCDKLL